VFYLEGQAAHSQLNKGLRVFGWATGATTKRTRAWALSFLT
jgi:hypothetical protein